MRRAVHLGFPPLGADHDLAADRRHERGLNGVMPAVRVGAQRQAALLVDGDHPHRHALVGAGDAMVAGAAHSITLALSSSSSCS